MKPIKGIKQNKPIKAIKRKKPKNKEIEIEPPKVDETTAVDIDEEYVKLEDEIFLKAKKLLKPETFNLQEHEINLREFQIYSAILEINCFEMPTQTQQINLKEFLRTGN